MKTLKLLFKPINLYYILLGFVPIAFKFIYDKIYISLLIFLILLLNELFYRLKNFSHNLDSKNIRLNLFLILIYSFFMPVKLMGLIFIFTFLTEKFSEIISEKFSYTKIVFKRKFDIGKIFFFFLFSFIIGSIFFYFYSGYIIKREIVFLFLSSITIGILDALKLSIPFYGVPTLIFINFIDFHLRISSINILFGSIISLVAWGILIFLDIIRLEKSTKYYFLLFFFYVGLGYMLFLFNYLFFIFYGIIFKIKKGYERFIFISDIKSFFFLSFVISIIFFIIPHYIFIKSSLVTALITLFLYKNYDFFYDILRKFFNMKKMKFLQNHTLNIIIFNLLFSFILLIVAYNLNLIYLKNVTISLVIINFSLLAYKFVEKKFYYKIDTKKGELIPFQLFLLWSIQ